MTVAELTQKLACCPQDAVIVVEVLGGDSSEGRGNVITTLSHFEVSSKQYVTLYDVDSTEDFTVPDYETLI